MNAAPRILLVDDEAPFRFSATVALRRSGFRVAEAPDGKEALSAILGSAGERLLPAAAAPS